MTDRARHSYKGKKGGQARRGNAGANKQASSNAKQIYKKFMQAAESNRERGSYTSGNGNRTVSVRHKQGSQTNTTSGSSSNTRKPTSTADRMKQFSTGGSRRQMTFDARKVQRDSVRSQTSIIKGAVESGVGGTMKGFGSMVEQSKATGKSGSINHKLGGSSNTRRGDRTRPGQRQPKRQDNRNTVKQIQEERKKAGENMANKGDKLITKGTKRIEEEKKNMSGFGKWLTDLEVAGIQFGGDALVGVATGGIGTLPSMYIRAAGSGMHSAEQMGADRQSAFRYGLATAGLEVATEKMFGLAKPLEKIYGKGVGDLLMTKVLGKLAKNTGKTGAVKQSFMAAFGEGLEEMVAEGVDPAIANKIYADALAEDKRDEAYRSAIQNGATEAEAKEYADKVYNSIHQSTSVADILRAGSIGAAMGGLLGGGASVIEASNGARIKQQFGKDGLRDIANRAANVDDKVAAVRAQEVHNRLKEGMDISDIQANMVVQAVQEQEAKDQKTQRRYNEAIGVEMRRNGYESPIVTDDNGNPVAYAPATNDKVQAIRSEAKERLNTVRKKTDTKMTEEESNEVADAYAAVMTGVATSSQVGMFTTSHPEARALFETMNPDIKLPKSNEQTREFLFGLSARNYVETAKQETEYRQDVIRGYLEEDMTIDYGTRGQEEFSKLMEDENIDPRMSEKADAAGVFEDYYRAGALGIPMEQVLQNGNPVHNLLTYAQKKAAYESGFADMSDRNAIPKGSVISMGQRVAETKVGTHRGKLVDSEHLLTGKQRRMYQALAEKINVNINIVSDEGANGFYKDGEVYLSVNNDGRGLVLVFGHEITHHIKAVSPESYEKLEKLVRDRWEERGGIEEAIKDKQKQYKEKINQDLTEEEALEEIIADATYEMFGDVEFVKKICASDKTFAQSILYAIRRVLADIRECLANGRGFTPSQNEALLSHLDILSEFEDLWLQGLRDAARAEAAEIENVERLSAREGGYNGKSMSNRAVRAYENGEKPLTKWTKFEITEAVADINEDLDISKMTKEEMQDRFLKWTSWHHTGAMYQITNFYSINDDYIENLKQSDVDEIVSNRVKTTSTDEKRIQDKQNQQIVNTSKDILNKINVIFKADETGLKTINGVIKRWMSGKMDIEEAYDNAINKLIENRRPAVAQWRKLPEGHKRHEDVELFDSDPEAFVLKSVEPLSARGKAFKTIKEYVQNNNETTRFSVRDNEKRNAGEKLTRVEFNRTYYAHKLNLRGKNLEQQIEEIKTNGFNGSGGFNIMPADINDNGDTDVATSKYGGREGDTVLLVPKEYVKNDSVVNGYKPEDYEIVTVERDFQPYYELYEKAYDEAKEKQQKKLNAEGIEELDDGTTARYSVKSWGETNKAKKLKALVDAGHSEEAAQEWIDQVDSIASIILNDPERLDYEADRAHKFRKPNGDYYKYTLDASTLCDKRRYYQGTYDAIQKALPNTPLLDQDVIRLRTMLKDYGYQSPCGICYVESQRKNLGRYASEWLENYENKDQITLADVTSTEGLKNLKRTNPKIAEDFEKAMAAKGVSSPKVVKLRTDYREDIKSMGKSTVQYLNDIGGLRFHSFSDFETVHLIDTMQAILDMAAKGLCGMAYTKVPNFTAVFGGTGIKINQSLILKTDENGNAVHDKNGRLVFDDIEGIPFEEASKWRDKHPDNVAFICVGKDMETTLELLADDRVDFVIPFHRSKWSAADMKRLGLNGYEDFATGHQENGIFVSEYWDYKKNGKENSETYLKLCADKGITPVFEQLLVDNGDGSYSLQPDGSTDGYWKLLVEGKMYNHKTKKGVPQKVVEPNFDMDEARRILDEYEGGADTLPVAQDVVDAFVEEYKNEHPETKYSIKETDSEGRKLTEAQREYFKDSKVVDEEGRLKVVYHGTNEEFTVFKSNRFVEEQNGLTRIKGYFSESRDYSETYGATEPYYLNLKNPLFVPDEGKSFEEWPVWFKEHGVEGVVLDSGIKEDDIKGYILPNGERLYALWELFDASAYWNGDGNLTEKIEEAGYDGVYWYEGDNDDGTQPLAYMPFNENAIKRTNNVYPTENEDIRYSLPEDNPPTEDEVIDQANLDDEFSEWAYDSSPYAQEGKAVRVKSEAELRKQVEQLRLDKRLTHGRLLDTKPIKKDIEDLLRTMATITQEAGNPVVGFEGRMSKQNQRIVDDTVKNAKHIYKLMKQGRDSDAVALAMTCADDIVSRIQIIDDANYDVYKKIKGYLKSTPMRISEEDSHDIPDFNDFKKDNFGKVRIVKEGGIPVEEAYSELSEMFPGLFDEDITHPAEMLEAIVDARGSFEPYDVMLTSEEREQLLKDTTVDLLDIIAEGQPYRTWADKKSEMYQTKVNMLRERYKEAMRDLREKERARADRRVQAEREKGEKRLEQEKERSARKVQEIKDKNKEQKAKQKDNKQRKEFWNRISKNHKTLSDWLVKPTDDKHIPENYKLAVAELLMALDMQTIRSKKLQEKNVFNSPMFRGDGKFKFQQLLDAYEEIFKDKGAGLFEYDDEMVQMLKTSLIIRLDGKSVDALDTKTMGEIDILLKAIVGNVRNANKAFAAEKETTISEMAAKVRDDCKQVVKRSGTFNDRKRTIGRWLFETNKLLNISMKKPREFFEHLGGGMTDAYMEIRHGMDKHFNNMAVLREEFGKIFEGYNKKKKPGSAIEKWRDTSLMKSFDLESGETITLNPAQIMSLYCLNKREQAHKHMYEGAGIIASRVQGVSGKVVKLKNEVEGTQVAVTRADVDKIISTLSEEQIKIAEQLQGLLNGIVQEWGNETSMLMFNYEKFTEKDYFPIKSDDAYVASNFDEKGKQPERIRNFGFTKGTDVNASNPIVIADIFEVVADHCNKMSLYNALAAPLSDFQRMYNTNFWDEEGNGRSSVQNELRVAFGTDVDNYISNLLADINNNTQVRPEETAALINKSLANYKKATIGLNLRVAVQQPTAIVRAFDIISPKYFVGMDKAHLIRNAKEMIEHCPIARWKSWGHNEVDMARDIDDIMMNRSWSRFDLITMGTYGALDIGTWGMIWSAVKKEVKATHPDVEVGTDEFWNLCNERASEVYDKTQVVDSVLHRSQVMRDQQIMVKLLTSFMAEPTTTFNMLQSDLVEARDLWAEGRKKEAMAKANRVIVVFTANAAAVSAAAAFIDWLRDKQPDDDDDDKEGWALWYANFLSNFVDNANVLMMIPFVKDVLQLKEGWGTSNMAFEGWESLMKSISEWEKFINGKSKKSNEELIWMTAEGIGLVAGIPVKSVHKDLTALLNRFGISFAAEQGTEKVRIETEDGGILEVYPQKETITDKFFKLIGIKDNSDSDKFLNKFGLNLSEEEKKEKAMNDKIREISEKVEGLEGEERDKKLWETITHKKSDDEPGLTQYLEAGNTDAAEEMLKLFKECGGSEEYFNEKMMKIAKSSYKKTIGEHEKLIEQTKLYDFMLGHGMTEADISKIARDSDTRKEFQKAYALGEEEKAILLLSGLINAGLTYEDYEWSCKNAYRTVNPSDYATGEFSWPTNGTITSGFGRRSSPTAGASSFHQAIDIGAPTGTPVNAADGGKVIYCGWYGGYGNRVVVDHGNGYKTCYSHLSGYQVKQGQVLKKGQQLGKVGSTGVSTGPHLDFQVEQNGQYVDPSKYLPK